MIDFHTHIIPSIDDGSQSLNESLSIIRKQYQKGIRNIILTPHFYPDDCIDTFLEKRRAGRLLLEEAARQEGFSDLSFREGAEVLLSVDICSLPRLNELCIEGTSYILLEMPYSHWSDWVYYTVQRIADTNKLRPIIAHVERYEASVNNPNSLLPFLEMGALFQLNTRSLHPQSSCKKLAYTLLKRRMIHLIGSDVHHFEGFFPLSDAFELINKKNGVDTLTFIESYEKSVLADKVASTPSYSLLKKRFGRWY